MQHIIKEKVFDGNKYRLIKGNIGTIAGVHVSIYLVTSVAECIDGTWDYEKEDTMGGYPGSHDTEFNTLGEAETCFGSLVEIGNDEEEFFKYIDMSNKNFPDR